MEKSEVSLWGPNGDLSELLSCTSGLSEEDVCRQFSLVRMLLKSNLVFCRRFFFFFSLEEFT